MVRLANGLKIRPARPRPRGVKRLSTSALPTCASATTRSSTSRSWLFSALAIADSKHLRTSLATRLRENSRSASAVATFLPRMSAANRLSFCGETRSMRAIALASFSARLRSCAPLPIASSSRARGRRCRWSGTGPRPGRGAFRLAVGPGPIELSRGRELAELVADHFLGHQHGNVLLPVVDAEGEPDELRQDGRAPAPNLDHLVAPRRTRRLCLFEQKAVDEGTLPHRTRHGSSFLLLPRVAARHDEFGGRLVAPGLLALGGEAPRGNRMTPARCAALAAAVRVIDRVHGDAAVVRAPAEPAGAARLADRNIHVIRVRHRPNRRHAAPVHQPLLAGIEPQDHVLLVASNDLGVGAGRTRELPALADLELDVVDDGADRHVAGRHGVAQLHVHVLAGDHHVALRQPLRREDVGDLAVVILEQREEAGPVRVVLDALDPRRDVELAALEVDAAERLLVAAAAKTHGGAAIVVAPAGGMLALGERLDWLALVQAGTVDENQLALARRDRVGGFERHRLLPTLPWSRRSCGLRPR